MLAPAGISKIVNSAASPQVRTFTENGSASDCAEDAGGINLVPWTTPGGQSWRTSAREKSRVNMFVETML